MTDRIEDLLARLEPLLPPRREVDWNAPAFRWRRRQYLGVSLGHLEAVQRIARIDAADLQHVEPQKDAILRNTEQFVTGRPANNVLLTGARGTGKSSLIRACLAQYMDRGLRLIEVDKHDLVDLPDIAVLVAGRPERFIVFCDDLSFEEGESAYKALKAALDGSIAAPGDNLLIYATSNRRHLMPEYMRENLDTQIPGGRRDPSRRVGRGEDLAVGALRAVAVVPPVPPGRLPRHRRALAGAVRRRCRRDRGSAHRGAAVRLAARLAFGARGAAVRARLRGPLGNAAARMSAPGRSEALIAPERAARRVVQ